MVDGSHKLVPKPIPLLFWTEGKQRGLSELLLLVGVGSGGDTHILPDRSWQEESELQFLPTLPHPTPFPVYSIWQNFLSQTKC